MHIKRANDDLVEEAIRLNREENVFERMFGLILTIGRIFGGRDILLVDPTGFFYFIVLIMS
jgi:hypothetical protein